jgi:hypothetical protein
MGRLRSPSVAITNNTEFRTRNDDMEPRLLEMSCSPRQFFVERAAFVLTRAYRVLNRVHWRHRNEYH